MRRPRSRSVCIRVPDTGAVTATIVTTIIIAITAGSGSGVHRGGLGRAVRASTIRPDPSTSPRPPVEERELTEIENRAARYSADARDDVLRLARELRGLLAFSAPAVDAGRAASPLYDALTGLLNAGAYGVRFAMARARATRFKKIFAVMSVDLTLPGGAGGPSPEDRELTVKHVAQRLESSVRATDTLARIGSGNFAVILEDLNQAADAERVKQIVQDALAAPLVVAGRQIAPELKVGIEFYPSLEHAVAAGSGPH